MCWHNDLHDYAPARSRRRRVRHLPQCLQRKPKTGMVLRLSAHGRRGRARWEHPLQWHRPKYPWSRRACRCLDPPAQRIVPDQRCRHTLLLFRRLRFFQRAHDPMDGIRNSLAREVAALAVIQTMIIHIDPAPRMESTYVITRIGPPTCRTVRPSRRLNC